MTVATLPPPFFSQSVRGARRFFLDLAPAADSELAVVCGGYEDCQPEYAVARDAFPYYSIELVARGRGTVALGGATQTIGPGSVFTYGPGVAHEIRTNRRSRLGKYFVNFAGRGAMSLIEGLGAPFGSCTRVSSLPEVQLLFRELIRDGARGDDASGPLCVAILKCIVLRIGAYRVAGDDQRSEPYETYERCVALITSHAAVLVSQQQAAAACGVSPAYLSRLFARFGRQSAYQFLTRLRMNLAAERLLDCTAPVRQVADELGYTDPFHFSRTFKATIGVSPSDFRRLR